VRDVSESLGGNFPVLMMNSSSSFERSFGLIFETAAAVEVCF
jgi:hypothetical protein